MDTRGCLSEMFGQGLVGKCHVDGELWSLLPGSKILPHYAILVLTILILEYYFIFTMPVSIIHIH
jgi:hypothetical protein